MSNYRFYFDGIPLSRSVVFLRATNNHYLKWLALGILSTLFAVSSSGQCLSEIGYESGTFEGFTVRGSSANASINCSPFRYSNLFVPIAGTGSCYAFQGFDENESGTVSTCYDCTLANCNASLDFDYRFAYDNRGGALMPNIFSVSVAAAGSAPVILHSEDALPDRLKRGNGRRVMTGLDLSAFTCQNVSICFTTSVTPSMGAVAVAFDEVNINDENCPAAPLECIAQVNVSLDQNCEAVITPEAVLASLTTAADYSVVLYDSHNQVIPNNLVSLNQLNENIRYEVFNNECSPNSCWGNILVEAKIQPVLNCINDTISCAAADVLPPPNLMDLSGNCLQSTFEINLINEVREDVSDCNSPFTNIVTRTFQATDGNGNTTTCDQKLVLTRLDFSKLDYPDGTTTIRCSDTDNFQYYDFNEDDADKETCLIPLPWLNTTATGSGTADLGTPYLACFPTTGSGTGTGIPGGGSGSGTGSGTIGFPGLGTGSGTGSGTPFIPLIPEGGATLVTDDGVELIEGSALCNTWVSYTDLPLPSPDGCSKKIFRTWNILEWHCNQEFTQTPETHIIEVVDDMAPEFNCPQAYAINAGGECGQEVRLPDLSPADGCGNGVKVQIFTTLGLFEKTNETDTDILVKLNAGPNQVRYVVSDECKNSSECIVEVTLRDGIDPVAICEQNTVISLSTNSPTLVRADVLDDGSWDECGPVTSCGVKMSDVVAFRALPADTIINGVNHVLLSNFVVACPLTDYFGGTVHNGQEYISEADLCQEYLQFCCSDLGSELMVIYRAMDAGGNSSDCMVNVELQGVGTTIVCPPAIVRECIELNKIDFDDPTIVNDCGISYTFRNEFDNQLNSCGLGEVVRTVRLQDPTGIIVPGVSCTQKISIIQGPDNGMAVTFPADITGVTGTCSLDDLTPTALNSVPVFNNTTSCSQLGYDFTDAVAGSEGCYRITRTWTVIDWCTRDNTGQFLTYEATQQITTNSLSGPTISAPSPLIFPTDSKDCERGVTITATTMGGCTSGYTWTYSLISLTQNAVIATGNGFTYTDVLAVGDYRMEWTVRDACGNAPATFNQLIEVESTKAPKPVCMTTMNLPLNAAGSATLTPSMINAGSSHPCYPSSDLLLRFDEAGQVTQLTYGCGDLNSNITVSLWVMLDVNHPSSRKAFCTTQINVTQGQANCLTPPPGANNLTNVSGSILTEDQHMIKSVGVKLGDAAMDMTEADGQYAFSDMPAGGSYLVSPSKDINHLNGVSTLDLIMIQRHILGIEELDSPYKKIAADINNSEAIDGVDLVELRKLILGIYEEFPENTSWRFFDESKAISDDPWTGGLFENYAIQELDTDMNIDFIGVKIGDVNGDAWSDELDQDMVEARSQRWPLVLTLEKKTILSGQTAILNVSAQNYERVSGWQGTLNYNQDQVTISRIIPGDLNMNDQHFHIHDNGLISMSYGESKVADFDNGTILFQIELTAHETIETDKMFSISSALTRSEAYRGYSEQVPLLLQIKEGDTENRILAAVPNPFVTYTTIEFSLAKAGKVYWEFYDTQGRLLHDMSGDFETGLGSIEVEGAALDVQGIIYIKMITEDSVNDFKMIRI